MRRRNWISVKDASEKYGLPHETMKQRAINRGITSKTTFLDKTYTNKTKTTLLDADELEAMMQAWRREYENGNGS